MFEPLPEDLLEKVSELSFSDDELAAPPGSLRLEVRTSPNGATGVFSVRRIPAGRLVESCPVLPIRVDPARAGEDSAAVRDMNDANGPLSSLLVTWREEVAVLLGCGALYRQTEDPNAFFLPDYDHSVVRLFARREILPGHEITVESRSTGILRSARFR